MCQPINNFSLEYFASQLTSAVTDKKVLMKNRLAHGTDIVTCTITKHRNKVKEKKRWVLECSLQALQQFK